MVRQTGLRRGRWIILLFSWHHSDGVVIVIVVVVGTLLGRGGGATSHAGILCLIEGAFIEIYYGITERASSVISAECYTAIYLILCLNKWIT